jgi:lipid-A-disaccharide synthase
MEEFGVNCFILTGEKSGEDHALSFLPALIKSRPDLKFWGVGGDQMQSLGVELIYHFREFSTWGFIEAIKKLPFYFSAMKKIEAEFIKRDCRYAILIDYQDFNLRLSKRLKRQGVKVFYYVAPQAWAWKAYRAKALQDSVHTLYTILPFEKDWFLKRGVSCVKSVVHPVWLHHQQKVQQNKVAINEKNHFRNSDRPLQILLLPGSRVGEIQTTLPVFLETKKQLEADLSRKIEWTLVAADHLPWEKIQNNLFGLKVLPSSQLANALLKADICWAASGTVTLTCAAYSVPTVVGYATGLFNEFIISNFIKYEGMISLCNIVHEKLLYPEVLQEKFSPYELLKFTKIWLSDEAAWQKIKSELLKTPQMLNGEVDVASDLAQNINEKNY